MANWSILPALHFAPVRLVAVCDLEQDRAKTAAEKFGASRWYRDYGQMFSTEALDAVIVQMHAGPRYQIVLDALEAGLHVFIPKPPARTLAETQALSTAALRADRQVMVNFQRRFSFGVRRALEWMRTESFGGLTQLLLSFCSGSYAAPRSQFHDDPTHAFLLDFAVHHIDLARYLGGEVARLALYGGATTEGAALAVSLRFVGGAVGTLQLNSQRVWWRNYDRVEITGRGSYIVLDDLWRARLYTENGNTFTENYSDERSGELTGDAYSLIEFADSVRERREPLASIHDSVSTMRIYQAIHAAVGSGNEGEIELMEAEA